MNRVRPTTPKQPDQFQSWNEPTVSPHMVRSGVWPVRWHMDAATALEGLPTEVVVDGPWQDRWGRKVGRWIAPLAAAGSRLRRARVLHPEGVVYRAIVESAPCSADLIAVASSLQGTALVRFSGALRRSDSRRLDVLGMAIRFLSTSANQHEPASVVGEQDLLLATIRFPWTLPFAPVTTRVRTFLWNHFHGVSPFVIDGVGRVKVRARSPRLSNRSPLSRSDHLLREVVFGRARFVIEIRRLSVPWHQRRWEPLAKIVLEEPIDIDQAALRFSPFRTGRGIRPVGFIHQLRRAVYPASQDARPADIAG